MQIAKMFAALGFTVDTKGLDSFNKGIESAKKSVMGLSESLNSINRKLRTFDERAESIKKNISKGFNSSAKTSMNGALSALTETFVKFDSVKGSVPKTLDGVKKKLDQLATSSKDGAFQWVAYADGVKAAKTQLSELKALSASFMLPKGSIRISGGSGGARDGAGRPSATEAAEAAAIVQSSGRMHNPFHSIHPLLPSGMGVAMAGVAGIETVKKVVETGRDFQSMVIAMKAVSDNTKEFNQNLDFTNKLADKLGINVTELGSSFSKFYVDAKTAVSGDTARATFTNFAEYFKSLHMSQADIKGAMMAVQQMFSKQQVMSQELKLQMGNRAAGAMTMMAKALGVTSKQLEKLMSSGQLGPDAVVKMANYVGAYARSHGGLAEAMKTSATAQEQFMNKLRRFSYEILEGGGDEALSKMFHGLEGVVDILEKAYHGFQKFSAAIKPTVDEIVAFVKNIDWLRTSILALGVANGVVFAGLAGSTTALTGATAGVGLFSAALLALRRHPVFAALAALIWLFKEVEDSSNGAMNAMRAFQALVTSVANGAKLTIMDNQLGSLRQKLLGDLMNKQGLKTPQQKADWYEKNKNLSDAALLKMAGWKGEARTLNTDTYDFTKASQMMTDMQNKSYWDRDPVQAALGLQRNIGGTNNWLTITIKDDKGNKIKDENWLISSDPAHQFTLQTSMLGNRN